ncbi:MAG TPA: hypothetical protein VJR29_10780 [bacterium]|nr:hypothetical protein [bacterium]
MRKTGCERSAAKKFPKSLLFLRRPKISVSENFFVEEEERFLVFHTFFGKSFFVENDKPP